MVEASKLNNSPVLATCGIRRPELVCWLLEASAEKMEGLISSVTPTLMPLVRMEQGQGKAFPFET
jgi:hypothetical protein